jgi:hypothetical protein
MVQERITNGPRPALFHPHLWHTAGANVGVQYPGGRT